MHENVPVRFGRGRLDSLATKGLAAYLIATREERKVNRWAEQLQWQAIHVC
jgi:hypothetical protein